MGKTLGQQSLGKPRKRRQASMVDMGGGRWTVLAKDRIVANGRHKFRFCHYKCR